MRIIFILIANSLMLIACQKKSLPVITERPRVSAAPVSDSARVAPDMARGKQIYSVRCARCHDAPDPGKFSQPKWDSILTVMMPRARLNREQQIHIIEYVRSNSAK